MVVKVMSQYLYMTIDGVEMPTRNLDELLINDEIVWSSNAGRAETALFGGDIVDEKTTICLNFKCIKSSEFKKIKNALPGLEGAFKDVVIKEPNGDELLNIRIYRATVTRDMSGCTVSRGQVVYANVSFDLIQQ
jgi:hypothetical protein